MHEQTELAAAADAMKSRLEPFLELERIARCGRTAVPPDPHRLTFSPCPSSKLNAPSPTMLQEHSTALLARLDKCIECGPGRLEEGDCTPHILLTILGAVVIWKLTAAIWRRRGILLASSSFRCFY